MLPFLFSAQNIHTPFPHFLIGMNLTLFTVNNITIYLFFIHSIYIYVHLCNIQYLHYYIIVRDLAKKKKAKLPLLHAMEVLRVVRR
jgi:hypothetical protein